MAKLPLINRKIPVKLLDTDLIEVNRRLPDGEIIALKINRTDIAEHNAVPEIDVYEEGKGSFTQIMRRIINIVPILPSRSCYGPKKHISEILWINNSFEIDLKSLALLDEVKSDRKEDWIKETYGVPDIRDSYANLHLAWKNNLSEVKANLDAIILDRQIYIDTIDSLNPCIPKKISCIRKYVENANLLKDRLQEAIANATEKLNYITETALPFPCGGKGDKREPGGDKRL